MTQARDPWTLVVAVAVGMTIGFVPSSLTPFLVGGVIDALGFSEIQAGWLGTYEMTAVALTAMLMAPRMARISRVRVGIWGALLAGSAQLGSAFLESYEPLVVARLAAGIGSGLVLAATTAAAAAARNPDRLYGYATASYMGAITLMTPAEASIIDAHGIAGGYAALGGLYLLGLPALAWLGRAARGSEVRDAPLEPLPRGRLLLLVALMAMIGLAASPIWAFMERFGVQLGIGAERIGVIASIGLLAGLATALATGAVGPRWGRTRPLILAFMLLGISGLSFGIVSSEAAYLGVIVLFLVAFLFLQVFLFATVSAFDPAGRAGPAAAGGFNLALGPGPALGGVLVSSGSYAALGWFSLSACLLGVLLVVGWGQFMNHLGADVVERRSDQ